MGTEVYYEKYRKLSIISLLTGIVAVIFCSLYFLIWALFDDFLTSFVAGYRFMPYVMFSYVCIGACLTIAAVVIGSIDLNNIKAGTYSRKGKGFDMTGIIIGYILILFGFSLWFVDFFDFVNIIS